MFNSGTTKVADNGSDRRGDQQQGQRDSRECELLERRCALVRAAGEQHQRGERHGGGAGDHKRHAFGVPAEQDKHGPANAMMARNRL